MSSIELTNVCLDYILKTGSMSFKQSLLMPARRLIGKSSNKTTSHSSFRALENINLDIRKGDRVGVIGKNGAGKSTLLRVLANIYKPNVGQVTIQGSVSTLFDIHLGLNLEASGYENIVTLGIMKGMSKQKAQSLIPDIENFTELGSSLLNPLRTYSTGMQMKLVFAMATVEHSEIVIIDEIIGAGDASFMKKATQRLHHMVDSSHILVLASHSNDIIRRFCNKIIFLEKGEIRFYGNIETGIPLYET